jgi:hypothetical protein
MATVQIEAVDAQLPRNPQIAYVKGCQRQRRADAPQLGIA